MLQMVSLPSAGAQDPVFSQFYLSPLQLNPGLAGLSNNPRFAANYRNQYPGFNKAYRTYAASYDQFFDDLNAGVGAWLLADDAGDGILKTIKGAGIFSYKVELNRTFSMKMGAEVGIVQSALNWDLLTFGDQIDDYLGTTSPGGIPFPTEEVAPEKNSTVYPDLGLGGVLYSNTLYAGIGVRHLNTPSPDFLDINNSLTPRLPMRWTFHGGASWRVFRQIFGAYSFANVSPSFAFVKQGPFSQFNGGVTLDTEVITFGLQYRNSAGQSESIIGSIGFRTNALRLGYSYDVTISGFGNTGGTHELGLVYAIEKDNRESRYNDCFQIFR